MSDVIDELEERVDQLESDVQDAQDDATAACERIADLEVKVTELELHMKEHCNLLDICLKALQQLGVVEKVRDSGPAN